MKLKILYVIFVILQFSNITIAQDSLKGKNIKKIIFIEAGGFGGYGSVNYEYLVKKVKNMKFSVRAGISSYHLNDYTNKFNPDLIIPVAINIYYGKDHNLDLSAGQTVVNIVYAHNEDYQPTRRNRFNTNLSLGYRYQKEKGGMMFKIAYAPMIESNKMLRHWILLDLGYSF